MTRQVVVVEILSAGAAGGAVFSATTDEGKTLRFIADRTVMMRPPVKGEVWDIAGVQRRHAEFGLQVEVSAAHLGRPSGRIVVDMIARSADFPGIGLARARKLFDEFGVQLYDILDAGEAKRLAPLIGPTLANVAISGWARVAAARRTYEWADRNGLPPRLVAKLVGIYGSETVEKLEDNPYRLIAFLSWKQVDKIAMALGIAPDDKRRLVAAAEAAAYKRLGDAHTWTERGALTGLAEHLLGLGTQSAARAIELAVSDHALIAVRDGFQPLGPLAMEQYIASRCRALTALLPRRPPVHILERAVNAFQAEQGIQLNEGQRTAVAMAATCPLGLLLGGAGVGKTTALKAVHAVAEAHHRRGWQMALSGRAAKTMAAATGRPAMTIAAFKAGLDAGAIDLEGDCLLVVDEASMLDLPIMYRLLRAMKHRNCLLLVGDPGQLPPIGFGLAFHILVADARTPRTPADRSPSPGRRDRHTAGGTGRARWLRPGFQYLRRAGTGGVIRRRQGGRRV